MDQINLPTTERNSFSSGFYFIFVPVGIIVDQASKLLVTNPFRNYNFAFSLLLPKPMMYGIYGLVLILVIWYLIKQHSGLNKLQQVAWSLVLAGALSNIGERVVLGFVRDFIYLFSGILNIADFLIMVGIALLLFQEIFPGLKLKFRK